ncbi:DUF1297 domain-containing protein [Candidatus Peregrinibacteria bacterium]|jgi:5-formaminoimidazole-4-carboxamide-1-(beta)-D-ribofuranosyl 5'-monophosphate synthetase|nr:DUF1297 domain-containing protein [Candidatus Peregrinibacteria bacterium]
MNINNILKTYDQNNISIGVLGGHSALDVCAGAKKLGFKTVCVARKGREKTYAKHYKSREGKGCIDEVILVDNFSDIVKPEVQEQLRNLNTIFIHNRYFWTYCNFEEIEKDFHVPIFGSRELLKLEERDVPNNQYYLLEKAGIRIPRMFDIPSLRYDVPKNENTSSTTDEVDSRLRGNDKHLGGTLSFDEPTEKMEALTLTKVNNAVRTYERENFVAMGWENWRSIAEEKLNKGEIVLETLQKAVIEEFVLGAQINFNFFYSPLTKEVELMGTDMRRQTNLDGWLRLPANEQAKIHKQGIRPFHIETGHVAVTCKESLIEKAYTAAENFIKACEKHAQPLIGPFALQGAIETDGKQEELIVFDVSMRIPGSPGTAYTPYTNYLYGKNMSFGERIAVEIKTALAQDRLENLLS